MTQDAVVVYQVSKRFRRYHADRPGTIHETFLRGFRNLMAADQFWGLRHVSFRVAQGSTLGVVGRNGAGKSTLLRLIAGVGRPDEGRIEVNGQVRALLNLGAGFHPELTGRENLFIHGVIGGLTRRQVADRFDAIIEFAELEDFVDSPLRTFSSGMQMRLAFSIAIHSSPQILLIDEVLTVGDIAFQRKCLDRIARLKAGGCTIILVTHDVGAVEGLCEQALWLRAGRVAAYGPAEAVVGRYLAEVDIESWEHALTVNA
jgi:lipopolysaccharide transport system ATP-binding protein